MRIALSLIIALLIATQGSAGAVTGIHWWQGDVEAAFAHAKKEGSPLFLYWGAVWCPPCNQIKKTIFTRSEFQEKMKLFVPVYLDGDTESAQIWGEKLKAKGYPTMIVFSPDGRELIRLPGGLQVEQFNEILDEAVDGMTPVKEVLESAYDAKSGSDVPDSHYRILAYYSWGQDSSVNLTTANRELSFRVLEKKIPQRLSAEKARLFALWFGAAMDLHRETKKDDKPFTLSPAARADADKRVHEILANEELRVANMEFVLYAAGDVIRMLYPEPSMKRTKLIAAWEKATAWIDGNESLSVDERLSTLIPALEFHQIERGDKPLPEAFRKQVSERVAWANKAATDAYTRQSAMSTAGWLLRQVGLNDEAKALYTEQLEKAVSPHYFMSSLSTLARKDGDTEEAVGWMRRAYEAAEGRATRFQWGTSYLIGLMDLVPEQADTIGTESTRVFAEVLAFDDAFAGRNHRRIQRLAAAYVEWNEAEAAEPTLAKIRKANAESCAGLAAGGEDSLRSRCSDFFANLGKEEG